MSNAVSEINAVKRKIAYEQIELDSNKTKRLNYEVIEASDFVIKNDAIFVDVKESTQKLSKNFSDYFNAKDVSKIGKKLLEKTLQVLDYVDMTKALYSLLPKDDGIEISNPMDIVSIGAIGSSLSFPLAMISLTADLVVTPMVMEDINQLKKDSEDYLTLAKVKGLSTVRSFLNTQSAKIGGYDIIENIPQVTHNKVLRGDINTYKELIKSVNDELDFDKPDRKTYSYILQKINNENRLEPIYTIDSIISI
ncbi:hypothetical protein Q4566_02965 [Tamlana sp. 2_MG-2023]|uniref:hypothetical protein n=1 Tax=unclassified Tamlana TaxID=2614803 RepID=UPI0026E17304|nr:MULTISPECIES: hypothetical protein [unclassified Tamlana]MDO6759148.1 hypothetical protein [Tamlana sp. 2_MG-2023]MDO6789847.1 hypothetical protein [Tamlana sp. 1_MG-2023]